MKRLGGQGDGGGKTKREISLNHRCDSYRVVEPEPNGCFWLYSETGPQKQSNHCPNRVTTITFNAG